MALVGAYTHSMEAFHTLNILLHVTTGSIALILGLIALLSAKGGPIHRNSGHYFLRFISVVILTGLIGVFVFGVNAFLLVLTILSGYVAFSGYRIIRSKSNVPKIPDMAAAVLALIVLGYFLYYFQSIGMIWSPIVIYSTVGALLFAIFYDFLRYLIPSVIYKKHRIWVYEHIYKMTSAFSALLSAFSGTVLEEYQPHSQYLPSVLGLFIIFCFMVFVARRGLKRLPGS